MPSMLVKPPLFYQLYDALYADKDYDDEVSRVLALAAAPASGRLLEIGSGTGNHSRALASLGYQVVGVEIDPHMVHIAEAKRCQLATDLGDRVSYHSGPITDLAERGFDGALAMFNVVTYVSNIRGLQDLMGGVADRLHLGAPFVFDAWNGVASILDPPRDKPLHARTPTGEVRGQLHATTDRLAMRCTLTYELEWHPIDEDEVQRDSYAFNQTLWPPRVLEDVVNQAGFEVLGVHPFLNGGRAARAEDWKIVFHCRRRD